MAILAVNAIVFCTMAAIIGPKAASTEGGSMEELQNLVLIAAMLIFFMTAWRERAAPRMAAFGAALFCIICFLRELELPTTGPITAYMNDKAFRWHETIALAAIVLPYVALRQRYIPELLAYVKNLDAWPFMLAGLLFGIGAGIDTFGGLTPYKLIGQFLEELLEASGYLILLATAVLFILRSGRGTEDLAYIQNASGK